MSFSDNIEYLMAHPGTVAVLVWSAHRPDYAGNDAWWDVLQHAIFMMENSRETLVSAVVGEHSILAETRNGQQCAVVYPTGHAASKVMRRMLRNAAGPKRAMRKVETPRVTAATKAEC